MEDWEVSAVTDESNHHITVTVQSSETKTLLETFQLPLVQGIPYPRFCNEERWRYLNDLIVYRDSDIVIASYPKCGTTWTEQIVLLLANGGEAAALNPCAKNTYDPDDSSADQQPIGKIWIEAAVDQAATVEKMMGKEGKTLSFQSFMDTPAPRILKTHAPASLLLGTTATHPSSPAKVIVVSRNPLDACVSGFYHPSHNSPAVRNWSFAAWTETWLQGYVPHGNYFDWMVSWQEVYRQEPERIFWLQYEQLKQEPFQEIRRLARFLQLSSADDDSFIEKVVQASSFANMKKQATEKTRNSTDHNSCTNNISSATTNTNNNTNINNNTSASSHLHLRSGTVGDWQRHFFPSSSAVKQEISSQTDDQNDKMNTTTINNSNNSSSCSSNNTFVPQSQRHFANIVHLVQTHAKFAFLRAPLQAALNVNVHNNKNNISIEHLCNNGGKENDQETNES